MTLPSDHPRREPGQRGIGTGLLIGLGFHALGLVLAVASLGMMMQFGVFSILWPFIAIAVISVIVMATAGSHAQRRRIAGGVLIISAAVWLIIIGPCIGLVYSIP
ncbi:MAG: hypothetical protein BGN97_01285 [Microbacterium sp. 69-10]|uniref:hypothetical protein n=1 Tax=Microbacterium sp. 69-10 TaxID=1895783 RepID=UPI000965569B|nr:hypothetical protein [Microbacterium sp. 69-10]OJU40639.1 MAG: hypothetical protein BGN97_01285 [Microbacterium sp. 69-10]